MCLLFRFQVSPAATAPVLCGFLRDLIEDKHRSEDMSHLAVDPSKMRRAREAVMGGATKVEDSKAKAEIIEAICFDGRKHKTKVMAKVPQVKLHPRVVKEEHMNLTAEPQGCCLAHFTPESASYPDKPAKKVAKGYLRYLSSMRQLRLVTPWNGYRGARIQSRKDMPVFKAKKHIMTLF